MQILSLHPSLLCKHVSFSNAFHHLQNQHVADELEPGSIARRLIAEVDNRAGDPVLR